MLTSMRMGLLLLALGSGAGCVATAHGQMSSGLVVYSDPPPPRAVVVTSNPGYVWVDGHWSWYGNQWVWADGYWERERAGHVFVAGYWQPRGRTHVWVEPRWRRHDGHVVVHQRHSGSVKVHKHGRARPAAPVRARGGAKVKVKVHNRGR
jgi:hypothetical protein